MSQLRKSPDETKTKKIATTVRISKEADEIIKHYVKLGMASSKPKFIVESIRDAMFGFLKIYDKLKQEAKSTPQTTLECETLCHDALMHLCLERPDYQLYLENPKTIQVGLDLTPCLLDMATKHYLNYLGLKNLQAIADYAICTKIMEFQELGKYVPELFITGGDYNLESNSYEEEIIDLLKKSGLNE